MRRQIVRFPSVGVSASQLCFGGLFKLHNGIILIGDLTGIDKEIKFAYGPYRNKYLEDALATRIEMCHICQPSPKGA